MAKNMGSGGFYEKNPVLKNKEFICFLLFRFGIYFALNLQSTAIYYWVYHLTGSNLKMGLIGLAEVIPAIVFSMFSGHFVDLHEKRKMLLICLIGYICLGGGLFYLSTAFSLQHLGLDWTLNFIFALIFFGGVLRAFISPSAFALLGQLTPREHYPNATSWSSMAFKIGSVVGPLSFGAINAVMGILSGSPIDMVRASGSVTAIPGVTGSMFLIFLVEALLLIPVCIIKAKPILKKAKEPILQSLSLGVKFILKTPALLGAQALDMFTVLFGGAVALLPAFVEIHRMTETEYGFLRAAPGIGSILTLILLAYLPLNTKPGKKLLWCCAGFGLSIIVFGLSRDIYLASIALVASGMFDAVSVVVRGTILQLVTPDEMRGRVAAVNTMFVSSSNELGDFESGVMAHWLGTIRAIIVGGCLTLGVVSLTAAKAKELRLFDYKKYA
ncbi:MFS transporter [Arachidicoccus ginsenosidivorans]